jgi:hypothetical protein
MSSTVQTSDLPRSLNDSSTLPTAIHTQLATALINNPSSIPAIERTLSEALAATGWTTSLRTHIQNVIRSGECLTFDECVRKVMRDISVDKGDGSKEVNGNGKAGGKKADVDGDVDVRIKDSVVKDGVAVIRKELEKVCVVVVDD